MSKIVYLCFNNRHLEKRLTSNKVFELLSDRLSPDNITPNPVKIIKDNGIGIAVVNPSESVKIKNTSVCVGALLKPCVRWYEPTSDVPDGNYALFRGNGHTIEVVTDVVASKTIWYYFDKDMFVASTSQRAIVMFLGSLSFNKSVIPWMISTGNMGYGNSWDNRINMLKGDSKLTLNRRIWQIDLDEKPVKIEPQDISMKEALPYVLSVYEDSFNRLDLPGCKWLMALSGGHDSRFVFLQLKDKLPLECVSWGVKDAIDDERNDVYIARKLAEYYGCNHYFRVVELKEELIDNSLNRLIMGGEGRTDNLNAYTDAFNSWKLFHEMDVGGIFRGDVGYNSRAVLNEEHARRMQKINTLKDYRDYYKLKKFGFEKQEIHPDLRKKDNESLKSYSMRLYQMYALPHAIAGWNDIVSPYVNVINPLISRNIVYAVRKLPESLLYLKKLHKAMVESISPDIAFAKISADEPLKKVLYNACFVRYISEQLKDNSNNAILDDKYLHMILRNLTTINFADSQNSKTIIFKYTSSMKKLISVNTKQRMYAHVKNKIDFNKIAWRSYIILRVYNLLMEDAHSLKIIDVSNLSE
jgi:hypothetical protein